MNLFIEIICKIYILIIYIYIYIYILSSINMIVENNIYLVCIFILFFCNLVAVGYKCYFYILLKYVINQNHVLYIPKVINIFIKLG